MLSPAFGLGKIATTNTLFARQTRQKIVPADFLLVVLGDQFPHLGNKIAGNAHDRLRRRNSRLVLRHRRIVSLGIIVGEDPPRLTIVPSFRKTVRAH